MTIDIFSADEQSLLEAWCQSKAIDDEVDRLLKAEGIIDEPVHYSRLDAWIGAFLARPRRVIGLRRHLGTVVWATSAPGFTFAGSYDTTWLPGFDVHVVTYSQRNSPFEYDPVAVGHLGRGVAATAGTRAVLVRDWRALCTGPNQSAWHEWWPGLVDETTAKVWREEAWFDHEDFPELLAEEAAHK